MSAGRWLVLATGIAIAATVAAAVVVTGTPAQQRASKLDSRRVADLTRIEQEVKEYWKREQRLPQDLDALMAAADGHFALSDPDTGASYAYAVTGEREYRLCATFLGDSVDVARRPGMQVNERWVFRSGEHCFQRKLERGPAQRAP